ncbi:MAG: serine aminopeptidase domain-containing protein [Janthinobacterium lividum]
MTAPARRTPAEPFFLDANPGQRFCLYHAPSTIAPSPSAIGALGGAATACRGALVMVHTFAEEMNRSRRMCAMQARALADAGIAVLVVDLYGCGDSSGDFGDARWQIWLDDLLLAKRWLEQRCGVVAGYLGLRLGALLALNAAADASTPVGPLVLWQPVLRGATYLTQFLRLRQAAQLLSPRDVVVDRQAVSLSVGPGQAGSTAAAQDRPNDARPQESEQAGAAIAGSTIAVHGSATLRQRLAAGASVEVVGYLLAAQLAAAIDAADVAHLDLQGQTIHWLDVAAESTAQIAPARERGVAELRQRGATVSFAQVAGPAFWATAEIAEAPELIAATVAVLAGPA